MFLTVALLMVLLTHLMPIGLAMMVLAGATLAALALTRRRPGRAGAGRLAPVPANADESAVPPATTPQPQPGPAAGAATPVRPGRTTGTAPEHELVGADRK
jgi:hypothetical protein